jgi:ATP-dependent Lhr-like helicase
MRSFEFHPAVARWFGQTFGSPTDPQSLGWPEIQSGRHVLISAPTGSGKTLAAFLASLDALFRQGRVADLPDETQVVYVSPLKALSNDIRKNLQEPLAGIRALLRETLGRDIEIRAEVRTGDTSAAQRQALARKPPHILVTTPESYYLLLTSQSGRRMLRTARTLILDEIHAIVDDRRGAHLALSIERLAALTRQPLQRIGLSATQKPIEEVARFLVGTRAVSEHGKPDCAIVDVGHVRQLDVAIEIPKSPLEAVMSNEIWEEVYHRLAELIPQHRTTLVFVNTRRLAERVTHHLSELLGADAVTSHHGSLSAKLRLDAEDRLKRGKLKALVATASLELGIDIGSVDLVCQLGTTRSIATFLQRIGRAEHKRGGLPKGRIFPLSRDELVECTALLRSVRRGDLDRLIIPEKPLDVLAQQIVAAVSCEDWEETKLFELIRAAWPYRNLLRVEFDQIVEMLAQGFSTKRGRRAALIHHDAVNHRLRARRGSRLLALTSGGAIPDNADYRVVLEPTETFIGTVNEDFAVESMAGDIFQLGNASWRILRINSGSVRVEDAKGQPPGIPFWLGEAPARTNELSRAVSDLRVEIEKVIAGRGDVCRWLLENASGARPKNVFFPLTPALSLGERENRSTSSDKSSGGIGLDGVEVTEPSRKLSPLPEGEGQGEGKAFASNQLPLPSTAAEQISDYFRAIHQTLGAIPSQETVVMERFFDESGGMQLVLHSPYGNRINRAWGLALRKRFCRSFNFELQAAATDDAIVISLGTQHSFPLEEVFHYLNSKTVRDLLVQALLDAPMFTIRWRWNASRALAVPRQRGGRRIPPPLQRMESENLLAAVFPDQLACLEHIVGDREVPDHPLVNQTLTDCLTEAMDIEGLEAVLKRIENGETRCIARDLPEPSPLAAEILNARPFAFLDNAPLEERRTQAVYTRRASERNNGDGLGILDAAAIEKVQTEAWPDASNADELHDTLMLLGVMTEDEINRTVSPENAAARGRDDARFPLTPALSLGERENRSPDSKESSGGGNLGRAKAGQNWRKLSPLPEGEGQGEGELSVRGSLTGRTSNGSSEGVYPELLHNLAAEGRATRLTATRKVFYVAAERLPMLKVIYPDAQLEPALHPPESMRAQSWEREAAIRELIRGRLEVSGPVTAEALARILELPQPEVDAALLALEGEGFILRGKFHPDTSEQEWCDRRLLARIHRLTIDRLRAEIQPVSAHEFFRFLLAWQRADSEHRAQGPEGLETVLELLDGSELPLAAWETEVLNARVADYDPHWLDRLCFSGRIGWGRLSAPQNPKARPFAPLRTSPIAFYQRESLADWLQLAEPASEVELSTDTRAVLQTLAEAGALFFTELVRRTQLLPSQVEQGLSQLAALGFVTCDGFDGLRALLVPSDKRPTFGRNEGVRRRKTNLASIEFAGRWSLLRGEVAVNGEPPEKSPLPTNLPLSRPEATLSPARSGGEGRERGHSRVRGFNARSFRGILTPALSPSDGEREKRRDGATEEFARALLNRYGVVFRRLLEREAFPVSWYELGRIYRRWEARGEIRGGYFVGGVSGGQFALPEAIGMLRSIRKTPLKGELIALSAADPLNLQGILTPGPRIAALTGNRILFRDGLPIAALEGGEIRSLSENSEVTDLLIEKSLKIGKLPVSLRPYYA